MTLIAVFKFISNKFRIEMLLRWLWKSEEEKRRIADSIRKMQNLF